MEKAMQNQKRKAKQEPDGARLLARTVKSGLPLKGSQADALEVERWRQTFAVKCAPGGTDWSISKELFSKAGFILQRTRFGEDELRMVLLDRGLVFTQEFDTLVDMNASFEDRVTNGRFYRKSATDYDSPLQYAEAVFVKQHSEMSSNIRKCFEQYTRIAKERKLTREQLKKLTPPTEGLTKAESEWLQKAINNDFLASWDWYFWIKTGGRHFRTEISEAHCRIFDEINEQASEFDRLRKKAIEWYELSDEQKKFASISQESAKIILEKFNSIYPQWTIRNIDKCAEKLIISEEKALFVMYTIVDKAKRSKASDKANRLIEEIYLTGEIYHLFEAILPEIPCMDALHMIWNGWMKDKICSSRKCWETLVSAMRKQPKLREYIRVFPPLELGMYLSDLLYTSLPESTCNLAYDNVFFVEAETVSKYKSLYSDQYKDLIAKEMKKTRVDEYQKLWINPETTREERIKFVQYRIRYFKDREIPNDIRIWDGFFPIQVARDEGIRERRMRKYSGELKTLILENVWQDCILDKARTKLWDMAVLQFMLPKVKNK